jgi:hypothetical protein
VQSGIAYITASFNNTIVTITDVPGTLCHGRPPVLKASWSAERPFAARLRPTMQPTKRWNTHEVHQRFYSRSGRSSHEGSCLPVSRLMIRIHANSAQPVGRPRGAGFELILVPRTPKERGW